MMTRLPAVAGRSIQVMGLTLVVLMVVELVKNPYGHVDLTPLILIVAGWSVARRQPRALEWAFLFQLAYCLLSSLAIMTAATVGFTPPGSPAVGDPGSVTLICTPGEEAWFVGRIFVFGIWSTANLLMLIVLLVNNNSGTPEVPGVSEQ